MPLSVHSDHTLIIKARNLTGPWYASHPGTRQHDEDIAELLSRHVIEIEPELIAAAMIAHSVTLAPADTEADQVLNTQLGQRVRGIVTGFTNEYQALTVLNGESLGVYVRTLIHTNPEAARVSAADKTILLTKLRAHNYDTDLGAQDRRVLGAMKTYYGFFTYHAAPHLPASLTSQLAELITAIPA